MNQRLFKKLHSTLPKWAQILLGIVLFFVFFINLIQLEPELRSDQETVQPVKSETIYYRVASITDGDTIKVVIDDKTETIRLANIDTPETVDPRRSVECMGQEASQKMTELVGGQKVRLEVDKTQTDRDRYNRFLRFIFLEDGVDVGLELIKLGFAQSSPYGSSPHKYLQQYEAAQKEAQAKGLGLWSPGACLTTSW